jgi:hypothetical protein
VPALLAGLFEAGVEADGVKSADGALGGGGHIAP